MNRRYQIRLTTLLGAAVAAMTLAGCDRSTQPSMPDNTARNSAARSGTQGSPFDQSEKSEDIRITAEIRRALMDDATASNNAKNCKVITNEGRVLLEGVVDSDSERTSVEAKAKAVAGVLAVENRLEVKRS